MEDPRGRAKEGQLEEDVFVTGFGGWDVFFFY